MSARLMARPGRDDETKSEGVLALSALLRQQKITNRLLAVRLKSSVPQAELILALASTGASHQEIAEVLGTTSATVSNVFVRVRKKAKGQSGRVQARHAEEDQ